MSTAASPTQQRTFLGHPIGLYVLFLSEMWERFSFYGMRALLTLYMVGFYRWSQEDSSRVYKWYTSLAYLTPLLGGYLADRFLGNMRAVVIGALIMAAGQFLLTMPEKQIFFAGLVCMIVGNGFFKPNISTQVGRLYPPNDPRRDGAYTIFYMGINLGAFLAPIVCGWLQENTEGAYHAGFAAAGIGMILGMLVYVIGSRWVIELDQKGPAARPSESPSSTAALSQQAAEQTPSAAPWLNRVSPALLALFGVLLAAGSPFLGPIGLGAIGKDTVVGFEIASVIAIVSAWVASRVGKAMRDRVLTIYIVSFFVVFFWAAFEQAGNAMNQWADKATDRYITRPMPSPEVFPPSKRPAASVEGHTNAPVSELGRVERWLGMFKLKQAPPPQSESAESTLPWYEATLNPAPTAWFQSINALAIFVLAPFFAMLWTALARRNINVSIPTKMAFGLLSMALGCALMIGAARKENQTTAVHLAATDVPKDVSVNALGQMCEKKDVGEGKCYQAGRMLYDANSQTLTISGVLSDLERDRIVGDTAPKEVHTAIQELQKKAQEANENNSFPVSVHLSEIPRSFDLRYTGYTAGQIRLDAETRTLTTSVPLTEPDVKALLVAAAHPEFRDAIDHLYVESGKYRVSPWWLVWFYVFSTIGELCLSPMGLSMVSKLAPVRFATMLMGMWFLTNFFGNFAAGAFGERWGTVPPEDYFLLLVAALGAATLVLFALSRKISTMMHGVK